MGKVTQKSKLESALTEVYPGQDLITICIHIAYIHAGI
jgi:hypothetical protein